MGRYKMTREIRRKMSRAARRRCTPEWRAAMSRDRRMPLDEQALVRYYRAGFTQDEVADLLGTTQKVVWRRLKLLGVTARLAIKRHQRGQANDSWKGSTAGYDAFHRRLEALFGRPQRCDRCKTANPQKWYDWANLSGRYDDPTDYQRMCRSCHRRYDAARRKEGR